MLRVTALSIAAIGGALGLACGGSYLLASRTASKAAARIAPDLGPVESDFGFHYHAAGEGEKLGWESPLYSGGGRVIRRFSPVSADTK